MNSKKKNSSSDSKKKYKKTSKDTPSKFEKLIADVKRRAVKELQKEFIKMQIENMDTIINRGRPYIHTIKGKEDASKLTEEQKKKTMVPTDIPKDVLNQVLTMAGAKGMGNFMSLSTTTARAGQGARVDLSDTPLTLEELAQMNYASKGIVVTGLHIVVPIGESNIVIPKELQKKLVKLMISHEYIPDFFMDSKSISLQKNTKVSITGNMPSLTNFSCPSYIDLAHFDFLIKSPHIKYIQTYGTVSNAMFKQLADLKELTHLYLISGQNGIPITRVANIASLEEFICIGKETSDVEAVGKLSKLKYLQISDSYVNDLEFLSECKNLEVLVVEMNNLQYIKGVEHLPKLKCLYLECNVLVDLFPLKYVTLLESLTLLGMSLIRNSMGVLSECARLQELTINNKFITSVKDITSLRLLNLSGNINSDKVKQWIKTLPNFPNLTYLILGSVDVPTKVLQALPHLKMVKCTHLSTKKIKMLQDRGVVVDIE